MFLLLFFELNIPSTTEFFLSVLKNKKSPERPMDTVELRAFWDLENQGQQSTKITN